MDDQPRYNCFLQLFLPAQRGLYGYLRTLIPNRADAEDVLQAAAAVMWEKFDDFQQGTRFDYWAYRIVRLQALRHLKQQKRNKLVFSDDVLAVIADRAVTISNNTSEVMDSLEECVERLSVQDREILRMRFEPGATNRSVALTLGRPERTVSRVLSQLYGDLLECIERRTVSEKRGE